MENVPMTNFGFQTCNYCGGKGMITKVIPNTFGSTTVLESCAACGGAGTVMTGGTMMPYQPPSQPDMSMSLLEMQGKMTRLESEVQALSKSVLALIERIAALEMKKGRKP